MNSKKDNQNGSALIGLLLAVLVLAVISTGSYYFFGRDGSDELEKNRRDPKALIDTLEKAKSDISDINHKTEEKNLAQSESAGSGNRIINITGGQVVSSPLKIEGEARLSENLLMIELRDQDHVSKVREVVAVKPGESGQSGRFEITLNFAFSNTKEGYVALYEKADEVGTELGLLEIPVKFTVKE